MRRALLLSVLFHVVVVALAWFGLPDDRQELVIADTPVFIDVVTVDEKTNVPPPLVEATPQPKPPPPPPEQADAPPPPPKPAPQEAALPPEPEPEPEPSPSAEPEPESEPEPEPEPAEVEPPAPQPPNRLANARPRAKPQAPDRLAAVDRALEDLADQPPPQPPASEEKPEAETDAFDVDRIAEVLAQGATPRFDPSRGLTISEIDLVRQQIARCWNLPAGAKDAENLVIEIDVEMNVNGTPQTAVIRDQARMRSDRFYRAAAETALRAVLNPRCHPFKLPPQKFDRWRSMTLVFNPKEMFGT